LVFFFFLCPLHKVKKILKLKKKMSRNQNILEQYLLRLAETFTLESKSNNLNNSLILKCTFLDGVHAKNTTLDQSVAEFIALKSEAPTSRESVFTREARQARPEARQAQPEARQARPEQSSAQFGKRVERDVARGVPKEVQFNKDVIQILTAPLQNPQGNYTTSPEVEKVVENLESAEEIIQQQEQATAPPESESEESASEESESEESASGESESGEYETAQPIEEEAFSGASAPPLKQYCKDVGKEFITTPFFLNFFQDVILKKLNTQGKQANTVFYIDCLKEYVTGRVKMDSFIQNSEYLNGLSKEKKEKEIFRTRLLPLFSFQNSCSKTELKSKSFEELQNEINTIIDTFVNAEKTILESNRERCTYDFESFITFLQNISTAYSYYCGGNIVKDYGTKFLGDFGNVEIDFENQEKSIAQVLHEIEKNPGLVERITSLILKNFIEIEKQYDQNPIDNFHVLFRVYFYEILFEVDLVIQNETLLGAREFIKNEAKYCTDKLYNETVNKFKKYTKEAKEIRQQRRQAREQEGEEQAGVSGFKIEEIEEEEEKVRLEPAILQLPRAEKQPKLSEKVWDNLKDIGTGIGTGTVGLVRTSATGAFNFALGMGRLAKEGAVGAYNWSTTPSTRSQQNIPPRQIENQPPPQRQTSLAFPSRQNTTVIPARNLVSVKQSRVEQPQTIVPRPRTIVPQQGSFQQPVDVLYSRRTQNTGNVPGKSLGLPLENLFSGSSQALTRPTQGTVTRTERPAGRGARLEIGDGGDEYVVPFGRSRAREALGIRPESSGESTSESAFLKTTIPAQNRIPAEETRETVGERGRGRNQPVFLETMQGRLMRLGYEKVDANIRKINTENTRISEEASRLTIKDSVIKKIKDSIQEKGQLTDRALNKIQANLTEEERTKGAYELLRRLSTGRIQKENLENLEVNEKKYCFY
jgi:hypothetical protein